MFKFIIFDKIICLINQYRNLFTLLTTLIFIRKYLTMKNIILIIFLLMSLIGYTQSTTCAGAILGANFTSGTCKTNQSATVAVPAGNCGGGFNSGVGLFYKFVAGTCPQFDVTFNSAEEVQFLLWSNGCTFIAGECSENTANVPITESYSLGTGSGGTAGIGPQLTNGITYVLEIVTKTTSNFSICYTASETENPDNECSGASGISPTGVTFYNGGNCDYTGSYTDGSTSDLTPASYCAGSLENTLWTKFQPTAGSTSIQIIGSNIVCGGPVCAWQFGMFSGTCGSLTPEGCISNGNACASGPDPNTVNATPTGTTSTYLVTWSGVSATGFTGTITRNGGGAFTGNEVFYLAMDGNSNSDCQFTLSGINLQTLPIELINFFIKKYTNANMIVWEVASQHDNKLYSIERSTDGYNWRVIKEIDGDGTNLNQKKYSFLDSDYENNTINYYRLKQTDFNGDFQYSNIIYVDNNTIQKQIVKIIDILGNEVEENTPGIKIVIYSDGTTQKYF